MTDQYITSERCVQALRDRIEELEADRDLRFRHESRHKLGELQRKCDELVDGIKEIELHYRQCMIPKQYYDAAHDEYCEIYKGIITKLRALPGVDDDD